MSKFCPRCKFLTEFDPLDPPLTEQDEQMCMECIFDDEEGVTTSARGDR